MAEKVDFTREDKVVLARALSVPILALLLALLLIYVGSPIGYPGSALSNRSPEVLSGEYVRRGLRTIAILFGLSCLPGGLIGGVFGYLIAQNSKLASAALNLLRIGQWAPFMLWWVLVAIVLTAPGQQPGRYFFIWTMGIPAVALGTCYHFLCTRLLLGLERRTIVSESAGLAVHRALFISLVLALSVWADLWIVFPGNESVVRHYVALALLALFLAAVNWTYRSGIEHTALLRREMILADLTRGNEGSFWAAMLIVLFLVVVWQLLNLTGYFSVSLVRVLNATVSLFSGVEIWQNMWVSFREIIAGIGLSGILTLISSASLLTNCRLKRWMLPIFSLTFAIPIMMLPTWHGWLLFRGNWLNFLPWQATCVACFSFFPLMESVWALRKEPLICRILLSTKQALPYCFAAILYGEMMSATAGLGFVVVVATATYESDKAIAAFLITLLLLTLLSTSLELVAKRLYPSAGTQSPGQ